MKHTKHTPGPWTVHHEFLQISIGANNHYFCQLPKGYEANAALIAAAPELLAALQSAVDVLKFSGLNVPDTYLKALAKATSGGQE